MKRNGIAPFLVSAGLSVAFSACGSSDTAAGFGEPRMLRADSLRVNQILKPVRWTVCNDKAVVQVTASDSLFYVYRLPDFRFLYAWGRRGNGPGEYGETTLTAPWDGDTGEIALEDYRTYGLRKFTVGERAFQARDTLFAFPDRATFSEDRPLPGGWLASKKVPAGSENEYFYVRDPRDGAVSDSIVLQTFVQVRYDDRGNMNSLSRLNSPRVIARGDRVAIVYEMFRHVDFYRVSPEGKLTLAHSVGEEMDGAALEKMKSVRNTSSQKGVTGYAATDTHIYTLYLELDFDWESKTADIKHSVVYVYDWEGRPAQAYELEHPATDILVERTGERLYARNLQEDFEWVYRYDMPRLSGVGRDGNRRSADALGQ